MEALRRRLMVDQNTPLDGATVCEDGPQRGRTAACPGSVAARDQEMDLALRRRCERRGASAGVRPKQGDPGAAAAGREGLEADEAQIKQLTAEEEKATGEKRDALMINLMWPRRNSSWIKDEVDDAKQI